MFPCDCCNHEFKTKQTLKTHKARAKPCVDKEKTESSSDTVASDTTTAATMSPKPAFMSALSSEAMTNMPLAMKQAFILFDSFMREESGNGQKGEFDAALSDKPENTEEFTSIQVTDEVMFYVDLIRNASKDIQRENIENSQMSS